MSKLTKSRSGSGLARNQLRVSGIVIRNDLTDTLQKFVAYAQANDSKSSHRYYANATRTVYDTLQVTGVLMYSRANRELRHTASAPLLHLIQLGEHIFARALEAAMAAGLPYKEAYQAARNKVRLFAELIGVRGQ